MAKDFEDENILSRAKNIVFTGCYNQKDYGRDRY